MTEGERWTRDALQALRAADYAPAAWGRFLAASHGRAAASRAARPQLTRQARAWMAIGALGCLARRRGLVGWGVTAAMLEWHLGMVETEDGRPRALGAADACTLLRAWLAPAAARDPRPVLFAVAMATDAADGALARASEPTRLGRDLEGLVDVCFSAAVLRGLRRHGRLGRVAASAEGCRLAAGAAWAVRAAFAGAPPPPAGRALTPLRGAGLLAAAGGHRRLANRLVLVGAVASVALSAADRAS